MSLRLKRGGRLIDRGRRLRFRFNGREMTGYGGDTLASALLGEGQMLVGRSFKYHRPRGIMAAGPEEPNGLVGLGEGARFEPDRPATTVELADGLVAVSQNHWPTLERDIGALNGLLARLLPAGFYYKTFIAPGRAWERLFEPLIRRSAGLGRPPRGRDPDRYEHFHTHVDVLVVGGGVAGLSAARSAAATGARVLLIEQSPHWGGRAPVDGGEIDGLEPEDWVRKAVAELEKAENVTMRLRMAGAGIYDHGYVLGHERVGAHAADGAAVRHRLWKIRARRVVAATGALERPLAFPGNDIPGVMLASAVRDYLVNWAVSPGERIVVVTNNDDAYRTALALKRAGLDVPAIVDARPIVTAPLAETARAAGIRVEAGRAVTGLRGRGRVTGVEIGVQAGAGAAVETVACDAVAMSGGWSPVVNLWSQCGGKLIWDADQALFRPDPKRPPTGADGAGFVLSAGAASGRLDLAGGLSDAHAAGKAAGRAAGGRAHRKPAPKARPEAGQPIEPVWVMPARAGPAKRAKTWIDFQNDVKVSDLELAAREGYESVEHAKRYTTLGMATDQGKTSNINGLAVLSEALDQDIPATGTTTFRPPWTPIGFGAIAGQARGALFEPARRSPIQDWHEANGAVFEPVGLWRRPYCYPRPPESRAEAVGREVAATRASVGMLDASTLGKLLVRGPDAGRFLDMLYTNAMSSLPVGRCRYGLMCNENGFLIDDGVVARISDDTWLCHTTSGGAERIHGWMEEWLQTEWWDWKVYVANLTEQFAQIAVAGPRARAVLERLGGAVELGREALPFMHWTEGKLGEFEARIFRISFSGELSFEVAVPAGQGQALWLALLEAGRPDAITPYGTEALHVMRAEKGFIMIGDETDGTVIPQDLGLGWAISRKKADYLGKRAQARRHMTDPERWRLVGLETLDGSVLPEGAYVVGSGGNALGQRYTFGRVTSTYHSPTLGRGIAMALVARGPERMGEIVDVAVADQVREAVKARIVSPVFYDPKGERQDV